MIASETSKDQLLQKVLNYCKHGWPESGEIQEDSELRPFSMKSTEISIQNGCLLWGNRVIIPNTLKELILKELHDCHPGISRMKGLARGCFWWPKMDNDIETVVNSCTTCHKTRTAPKPSELHPWEWPDKPWQRIHIDYAGPMKNAYYLVIVDAHSKWVEIFKTNSTSSAVTIRCLRSCFARFGLLITCVSDNASTFTSAEFQDFMKNNGITHITSAPYHPATNGLAENMVKTFKSAYAKVGEEEGALEKFLFRFRITPHSTTGKSPAELMFNRQLRIVFDLTSPFDALNRRVRKKQENQKKDHDPQRKQKIQVETDSPVLVRDYRPRGPKWVPAKVTTQTGPVSFECELPDTTIVRRHADQVIATPALVQTRSGRTLRPPDPYSP